MNLKKSKPFAWQIFSIVQYSATLHQPDISSKQVFICSLAFNHRKYGI